MKKKLIFTLLGVLMALPALARDFTYEYEGQLLTYTVISEEDMTVMTKEGTLMGNPGNNVSGDLIIPEIAKDGDVEYTVIGISDYAFDSCNGLTSVTIGDSVTSIGNYAFQRCSGLTSMTIGNSVTSIGEYAFYYCSGLTSVTIPNSVETIGKSAFYFCSGITSVTIGNSVTSIGESAFDSCNGLTSVTIGDSVTTIGKSAFSFCSRLASVAMSESVISIGDNAFFFCSALNSVTISNSVESIGNSAFFGCSGLTSLIIGNSVESIGNSAFNGCSSLTSLIIPSSVESIGDYAFFSCYMLKKLACTEELSNNFSDIEFKILYDKNNSIIEDGFVFSSRKDHIYFAPITLSDNYELPETVETIGVAAFAYCNGLTSVKLNDALTSIGENAFAECKSISVVEYPATTPIYAPENIFIQNIYDNATLYVPEGSVKMYEKTVPWKNFYKIEEMDFREAVAVSSVSFKQSSYAVEVGNILDLNIEVVIMPEDATEKTLAWESSNESVATVSNGIVTLLAEGTCEITATTTDGSNLSARCTLNASVGIESVMATDELCDVYSVNGVLIQSDVPLNDNKLTPGIYIIRQGRDIKKVVVK